jgi:DNA-binding MarR family transcriptional regulator
VAKFRGYTRPTYTMVPDELFDEQLPDLSGAELKVLLYIIRRTLGFKKDADTISLSQICNGITRKDGRQLDRGTGLNRDTVSKVVKSLEDGGYIIREMRQSTERGNEPTVYRLNFIPWSENPTSLPDQIRLGGVGFSDSQQTVIQETDPQQTEPKEDPSKIRRTSIRKKQVYDEARLTLIEYISDLASEFIDTASVASSTTRAVNLYRKSGVSLEQFIDTMTAARAITKERIATITKRNSQGDKSKMAYFFRVLEDCLEPE